MSRQKPGDKIETLRRQQAELAAKLKEAEAKARDRKRDDEQRRERLTGRCILAQLGRDSDSAWSKATLDILSRSLTRAADRGLFPALASRGADAVSPETAQEAQGETLSKSAG